MTIELPTLPYDVAALEPTMSTDTLSFHLSHHERGDFDRATSFIRGTELSALPLEELVRVAGRTPGCRTDDAVDWDCANRILHLRTEVCAAHAIRLGAVTSNLTPRARRRYEAPGEVRNVESAAH